MLGVPCHVSTALSFYLPPFVSPGVAWKCVHVISSFLPIHRLADVPRHLYRRHEFFHQFAVFLRILIAARAGNAEPLIGFNIVLFNPIALVVQHPEIGLAPR